MILIATARKSVNAMMATVLDSWTRPVYSARDPDIQTFGSAAP